MAGWAHSRVLFAVELVGSSLQVRAMTVRCGASTFLLLSTAPWQMWGNGNLNQWLNGGWDYQSSMVVPPTWPIAEVDPWAACSTWKALDTAATQSGPEAPSARFCGNCGAQRGEGFVFCGDCGSRFDAVVAGSDAEATLRSIAADPARSARLVAQLLEEFGDNAHLTAEARRVLADFVISDFAEMTVRGPVDGVTSTSRARLTLAGAQDIQDALVDGTELTAAQHLTADILVRQAPWTFGYWGPAKALMKSGLGRTMAEPYAIAVARISSSRNWAASSNDVEALGFMSGFMGVSTTATVMYMARRVRRDLKAMAERTPDQYAQVAARVLMEWDEELSAGAFAPAYIMLGGHTTLGEGSQRVNVSVDMTERRDAHPEVWDARLGLVRDVFSVICRSPEAHTWAYQVLEANGDAPPITAELIGLSLRSSYAALSEAAVRALPSLPRAFEGLSSDGWTAFFRKADAASFDAVLDQLTVLPKVENAVSAARGVLESQQSLDVERGARLAVLYLAGTPTGEYGWRPGGTETADVAALLAIAQVYRFEPLHMWEPILDRLSQACLDQVLFQLAARTDNHRVLVPLTNALLAKFRENKYLEATDLVRRCLQHDAAEVAALGWQLIDERGGLPDWLTLLGEGIESTETSPAAVILIVQGALARANGPQIQEVLSMALGSQHPGLDPTTVAALILGRPGGARLLWDALAASDVGQVLTVATATTDAVTAVGGVVDATQITSAGSHQLEFLRTYLRNNPGRIPSDPEFGVAASGCLDPELQQMALHQLNEGGHIPRVWLQLAESAMPACLYVATAHIESRRQPQDLMEALLACLDSQVTAVRDLGLRMLQERQSILDDPRLWTALSESDEPAIQRLVAEEALARGGMEGRTLIDFDRRVLSARRRNRSAKEAVKTRLAGADDSIQSLVRPERIEALLDMARGSNDRDRSWALSRLAALHLSGVDIPDLDVSVTTAGGAK